MVILATSSRDRNRSVSCSSWRCLEGR